MGHSTERGSFSRPLLPLRLNCVVTRSVYVPSASPAGMVKLSFLGSFTAQ